MIINDQIDKQLSTTSSLPSLPTRKSLSFTAKCLIGAAGGGAIGLTIVCASFVAPAFRRVCLPYVPATNEQIRNVLSLLPTDAKGRLLDIGSGDGRIVQSVAQQRLQIISEGVEINPWLVWYSRCKAMLCSPAPLRSRIRFHRKDLWRFDLKSYQYIVIFGVDTMVKKYFNYNNIFDLYMKRYSMTFR